MFHLNSKIASSAAAASGSHGAKPAPPTASVPTGEGAEATPDREGDKLDGTGEELVMTWPESVDPTITCCDGSDGMKFDEAIGGAIVGGGDS
jgi:hypothetical protein